MDFNCLWILLLAFADTLLRFFGTSYIYTMTPVSASFFSKKKLLAEDLAGHVSRVYDDWVSENNTLPDSLNQLHDDVYKDADIPARLPAQQMKYDK